MLPRHLANDHAFVRLVLDIGCENEQFWLYPFFTSLYGAVGESHETLQARTRLIVAIKAAGLRMPSLERLDTITSRIVDQARYMRNAEDDWLEEVR